MCALHFKVSLLSANTNDTHVTIEQFSEVAVINNEGISPHLCVLLKCYLVVLMFVAQRIAVGLKCELPDNTQLNLFVLLGAKTETELCS